MRLIRSGLLSSSRDERVDAALTVLLVLQGLTLFLAIPLGSGSVAGRVLLDTCHLAFATVCIGVLTRRRSAQAALATALVLVVAGPAIGRSLRADLHLDSALQHELIALAAFSFNGIITVLVARHVFAGGRVTVHRVRGAVLLYLNVAALFAIAYGAVELLDAGAFVSATGVMLPPDRAATAAFSYFSLTTITTTGFGDITPAHPLARSLATLEAVFGQLFPATLLARIVALHLAHEAERRGISPRT